MYLVHGSNANRSKLRRSDYAIRYMPASTRYVRDPAFPANAYAAKESPLMNYIERPLWQAFCSFSKADAFRYCYFPCFFIGFNSSCKPTVLFGYS